MSTALNGLTREQRWAAASMNSDVVVTAGAGTGKTTLLVGRVLLLLEQGILPGDIAVLTFTRKAAAEITERIQSLSSVAVSDMHIGTFHSVMLDILKSNQPAAVIDEDTAKKIVKDILTSLGAKGISKNMVDVFRTARSLGRPASCENMLAEIANRYEMQLTIDGAVDWLSIITKAIDLGGRLPPVKHIIVDEAQDTDELQWHLVDLWQSVAGATIFCVGDDRQQIYEWRGVKPEMFINRPGTRYSLTESFRFPEGIAQLSNAIATKAGSVSPPIVSRKPLAEGTIQVACDGLDAISAVEHLQSEGFGYGDMALLCRWNAQVDAASDMLTRVGIQVAKAVEIDHKTTVNILRYLDSPWCSVYRRSLAEDPVAVSMLPTLADPALSDDSAALIAQSWVGNLGVQVSPAVILSRLAVPDSGSDLVETLMQEWRDSFKWWINKYAEMPLAMALRDFATREAEIVGEGVTVCTVHQAKGLEFPSVVMCLPSRHKESADEWRTLLVGCTRAKELLLLLGDRLHPLVEMTVGRFGQGIDKREMVKAV